MMATATMARLGFDVPRLHFALRTAAAACIAFLVSWLLGLEHPQWSGMTVWAASQPTRGQLLEKSFFRMAGTVSGTIAGVVLVLASAGQPWLLVAGLAVWSGLCAGIGNIQRGFVSYGTMLAGYSAAMVALLDAGHPDHVLALAADRLLTVLVGVVAALLIGLLFTPDMAEQELAGRVRRLCARVLRNLAGNPDAGSAANGQHAILAEMAAIDEMLDPHGAGSLRSRQSVRAIRRLLLTGMSALLREREEAVIDEAAAAALVKAAEVLETSASADAALAALEQAGALFAPHPSLRRAILDIRDALRDHLGTPDRETAGPIPHHPVMLHRDWIGGRESLIRASVVMLAVGGLWLSTGWSGGPFMMLGTAIMISLFSTMDNPALTMRHVLLGSLLGGLGALACRWLVWPLAADEASLVFLTMPFILLGALILSHRKTMPAGFDYNMILLLLLHPAFPLEGTPERMLNAILAVLAAPVVALVAYKLVFPINGRYRLDSVIAMMVRDVQTMAAAPGPLQDPRPWRARLYHRLLRLVRWGGKSGEREVSATAGGLAALSLGDAVVQMRGLLQDRAALPPGTVRSLEAALKRMADLQKKPGHAARLLDRTARRLPPDRQAEADLIRTAAAKLAANLRFFERAARKS